MPLGCKDVCGSRRKMTLPHRIPTSGDVDFSSPYDELNRKIVALLQQDGRTSFRTIAEMLDVSEGTVRNRVNWMKEAGQLTIAAIVDPASISYRSDAMLGIKVAPGHTPASVAERVGKCPNVVYLVWIGGRYDLLIEVVFESDEELPVFMDTYCYSDPGIASVEIMIGIKMFKNQFLLKRDFSQLSSPIGEVGK